MAVAVESVFFFTLRWIHNRHVQISTTKMFNRAAFYYKDFFVQYIW